MAGVDNLTSWKPGQSGNPKGKPKGIPNSKTRLRRLLELTEDLKNPVTGDIEGFTVAEQLDMQQIIKARRGDTMAYKTILDRLEGKPEQSVDVTSAGEQINTGVVDVALAKEFADYLKDKTRHD